MRMVWVDMSNSAWNGYIIMLGRLGAISEVGMLVMASVDLLLKVIVDFDPYIAPRPLGRLISGRLSVVD